MYIRKYKNIIIVIPIMKYIFKVYLIVVTNINYFLHNLTKPKMIELGQKRCFRCWPFS